MKLPPSAEFTNTDLYNSFDRLCERVTNINLPPTSKYTKMGFIYKNIFKMRYIQKHKYTKMRYIYKKIRFVTKKIWSHQSKK